MGSDHIQSDEFPKTIKYFHGGKAAEMLAAVG
jgi:hypothetical protein